MLRRIGGSSGPQGSENDEGPYWGMQRDSTDKLPHTAFTIAWVGV